MSRDGENIEAWLPIDAHRGRKLVSNDSRYAYIPPEPSQSGLKLAGGVALYAGMLALLYSAFALTRAARATA
jgi:hypothetical protein